jgi:hypothetical protein
MGRPSIGEQPMTGAERQARYVAKGGRDGIGPVIAVASLVAEPLEVARQLRRELGYLRCLALRDALDKAMDEGDPPEAGYLLRSR